MSSSSKSVTLTFRYNPPSNPNPTPIPIPSGPLLSQEPLHIVFHCSAQPPSHPQGSTDATGQPIIFCTPMRHGVEIDPTTTTTTLLPPSFFKDRLWEFTFPTAAHALIFQRYVAVSSLRAFRISWDAWMAEPTGPPQQQQHKMGRGLLCGSNGNWCLKTLKEFP